MKTISFKFLSTIHNGCALQSPFEIMQSFMEKDFRYASRGRWALYHCVKSLMRDAQTVLLPSYICSTVVAPLKELGLELYYYDCEVPTCNPSVESLEASLVNIRPDIVILASMYGNGLNYDKAISLCNDHNALIIDDAAQSFGATYKGKAIGSFGDAGFISLSPAKPVTYALGAYYWTSNKAYQPVLSKKDYIHKLLYWEYVISRVRKTPKLVSKLASLVKVLYKLSDFKNHDISEFELNDHALELYSFLEYEKQNNIAQVARMAELFEGGFDVISSGDVFSSPSKFVVYHEDLNKVEHLKSRMKANKIYVQNGYSSLGTDKTYQAYSIGTRILEIPIARTNDDINLLKRVLNR